MNWVSHLSNARKPGLSRAGWEINDLCFAFASPPPTNRNPVQTPRTDAVALLDDITTFPELSYKEEATREEYEAISNFRGQADPFKVAKQIKGDERQLKQLLNNFAKTARARKHFWPHLFNDLDKIGIQAQGSKQQRYFINVAHATGDVTGSDAWNAPLFYAIGKSFGMMDVYGDDALDSILGNSRHDWYTFTDDPAKNDPAYKNTKEYSKFRQSGIDKASVSFPPVKVLQEGNSPGTLFGRGGKCGTPNAFPRIMSDPDFAPKWINTFFKRLGIIIITKWSYRVACACEICGMFQGCLTLNNGDHEKDKKAGVTPSGSNKPHSIRKMMAHALKFANLDPKYDNPPPKGLEENYKATEEEEDGPTSGNYNTAPPLNLPKLPEINILDLLCQFMPNKPNNNQNNNNSNNGSPSGNAPPSSPPSGGCPT